MSELQHDALYLRMANDSSVKLTTLRKAILAIFVESGKAMGAYDVLAILKKNSHTAEPMTVYRVIDYFIKKNIIHRISTENKFVLCAAVEDSACEHHGLFLICKHCHASCEVIDKDFDRLLTVLSDKHRFIPNTSFVEVNGICQACYQDLNKNS